MPTKSKGVLVDLFEKELTQEEWNALCIVHRLGARLNVGIRFDWNKSIDVRSEEYSQIIDESVFLNQERNVSGNEAESEAELPSKSKLDLQALQKQFDVILAQTTKEQIEKWLEEDKVRQFVSDNEVALPFAEVEPFFDFIDRNFVKFMSRWEIIDEPQKGNWTLEEVYQKYKDWKAKGNNH